MDLPEKTQHLVDFLADVALKNDSLVPAMELRKRAPGTKEEKAALLDGLVPDFVARYGEPPDDHYKILSRGMLRSHKRKFFLNTAAALRAFIVKRYDNYQDTGNFRWNEVVQFFTDRRELVPVEPEGATFVFTCIGVFGSSGEQWSKPRPPELEPIFDVDEISIEQLLEVVRPKLMPDLGDTARSAANGEGESDETPMASWSSAPRFGNWLLLGDKLGRGGQGQVTLVRHSTNLGQGALKRMTGPRALTPKGRARFLREIEAFRSIRHPFVVSVLDAGDAPEPFLVTEVAAFGSLHDNLVAFQGDLWRCLRLARGVALGLAAAHARGIIHRDIKPKNILLESLDHPLVADFGVAHFEDKEGLTSLGSNPGAIMFAPEEWEFDEEPTPAFDVFSLGAVLHCAITGEQPKKPYRLSITMVDKTSTQSKLGPIDDLIVRMTEPKAADRIQTMMEVVAEVDAVTERLFGRVPGGSAACACEAGAFADIGKVVLGGGTEFNVYPSDARSGDGFSLGSLLPRLEMCSACGALRLRSSKSRPRK